MPPSGVDTNQASAAATLPPKLELAHLSVAYSDSGGKPVLAVDKVSLSLANKPGAGELAVFLGPSGCGKSTILKTIAGLIAPSSGEIFIDGSPAPHQPGRDRGMVFQNYTSFGWRTVLENVEYGLQLQGIPRNTRKHRALEIIRHVGLGDFAHAYPKQLSGGMKQRVAIARTLINEPKLILMDEPFGALDPQTRWSMQALMLDVLHAQDSTVLFVTHDISEAVFLADVIFVLSHRPAKVLKRIEVPSFSSRDPAVKQSAEFKAVESQLLDMLHSLQVQGDMRVGL